MSSPGLQRFTYAQRVVHWVVGLSFVLLLFTGFAFSYPSLFWITALFGGGAATRVLHPIAGVVFALGLAFMFLMWVKDMFIGKADIEWMKAIQAYVSHQKDKVPPTGKYNGGQKMFFWVEAIAGVVLLLTGLPMWMPEGFLGMGHFSGGFISSMRLLHYLAALGGGLFLIIHVYLGTVAYPGTLGGMISGKVSRGWARMHHPLWYKEKAGS
jgi:formate dehydrogenase subunit gamma